MTAVVSGVVKSIAAAVYVKCECFFVLFCLFIVQLEEANRTLTSDVANLANEKEELNNKMKEALEGKELLFSND